MFSGSNSFLGGTAGRPSGPPQYNSFVQGQQPQTQQFAPQPTGYGQPPQNPQAGGFPSQMQPQPTGFQPPMQQPQFTGYPGAQGSFGQAPQQQGYQPGPAQSMPPPQQQLSSPPIQPQPTGFSQMAASFQNTPSSAKPKGRRAAKSVSKIPSIRLSFITAKDQAQFETLFKSAAGDETSLSGDKSRDILLRSNLDGNSLSQIWCVVAS